jgi:hypothetical protein
MILPVYYSQQKIDLFIFLNRNILNLNSGNIKYNLLSDGTIPVITIFLLAVALMDRSTKTKP